jgi:peptidoglycan hydrolase-like protein with peptidoglycan-binding domain
VNRRSTLVAGAAVLAAGGVTGVGGARWWGRSGTPAPQAGTGRGTVAVVRTDLVAREQIGGVLGYAGDWLVTHPGPPGVLTAAPAPAAVIQRGQQLYEVDGRPVHLLYGGRPVWRDLRPGMPRGEDVRQLEQNLAALGHLPSTVDTSFTATTEAAVRRWQRRLGVPQTGHLPLGTVVFAPEALRIVAVPVPPGGHVGGGPVLRASSTRRVVTVALPTSRQGAVRPGSAVDVALPGGPRVTGTVTEVGGVAVSNEDGGPTTLAVTVRLERPAAAGTLDQAPVLVTITTASRPGVLAVPLTALRASAAGGYEVTVDGRAVPVQPGLLDERAGLIEVSGGGLAEGLRVEVP